MNIELVMEGPTRMLTMRVHSTDLVYWVKLQLAPRVNIPPGRQHLMMGRRELIDFTTLGSNGAPRDIYCVEDSFFHRTCWGDIDSD